MRCTGNSKSRQRSNGRRNSNSNGGSGSTSVRAATFEPRQQNQQNQQQQQQQEEQPADKDAQATGRPSRNFDHRRPNCDRGESNGIDNREGAKRRLLPSEDTTARKTPGGSPNVKPRVQGTNDRQRGTKRPWGAGIGNGKDAGNDNDSSNENDNGNDASSGDAPGAARKASCAPPPRKRRRIDSARTTPCFSSMGP